MVLLPCSACCQSTSCTCASCSCCKCDTWQSVFNLQAVPSLPFPYSSWGYTESYYNELYSDLVAILPNCISRLYESQSECVDALVAQAMIDFPSMTEQEIRDAFGAFWEETECQPYISKVPYGSDWHGWSVPYINGQVASPEALTAQCPNGSGPSPLFCSAGYTAYNKIAAYTTGGIPEIRLFVLSASTGDSIADSLLALGTLPDLPAEDWFEATDCATCDSPPELEFDCSGEVHRKTYAKTVSVRDSRDGNNDEIPLCPPENCKIVRVELTRTDYCDSLESPVLTTWVVEVAVCPCQDPFILETSVDDNSEPIVTNAYGHESEFDCMNDLDPDSLCTDDKWKLIRISVVEGERVFLEQECDETATVECCE